MQKIVYLDSYTLNPGDLSWAPLEALGQFTSFPHSRKDEILERAQDATILLANKAPISADILAQLPKLECICVTATGFNNVDVKVAKARNITVCNVVAYGTSAVAQHVFALLLNMTNAIEAHSQSVKAGDWSKQIHFAYWNQAIIELSDLTMGIYGFGRIGRQVAKIAQAFGMKVIAHHKHPKRDAMETVDFVSLEELFKKSDVVSLHAPLTAKNKHIVNAELLKRMKPSAYLINTGRGDLIHESDLYVALKNKQIAGAGLDVLSTEPPLSDHPLFELDNCWVTPHQAWASRAARQRLLDIVVENIKAFQAGTPQNEVG